MCGSRRGGGGARLTDTVPYVYSIVDVSDVSQHQQHRDEVHQVRRPQAPGTREMDMPHVGMRPCTMHAAVTGTDRREPTSAHTHERVISKSGCEPGMTCEVCVRAVFGACG